MHSLRTDLTRLRFSFWRFTIRQLSKPFAKVDIQGIENIPKAGPLLIIGNHFSYYDPVFLLTYLPIRARFLTAVEMTRIPFLSYLVRVFDGIPVWRGQVDRQAMRAALETLQSGQRLGVFPEGGIMPELQEKIARGELIVDVPNSKSRLSAQLARPRPGAAYLAVNSDALLLPVAMLGTQHIESNMPWRRTPITIRIGQPFGPLQLDPELRGRAKRRRLDEIGDLMMQKIAELMPPANRGPYSSTHSTASRSEPAPIA